MFQASVDVIIPGRRLDPSSDGKTIEQLTSRVRDLCGWRNRNFPGSQPVSCARHNVTLLGRNHYVACEKSDGVRYLLFAASKRVFLIDRMETVQEVQMILPYGLGAADQHQLTLLDGEMVTDQVDVVEEVEEEIDGEKKTVTKMVKHPTTRFLIYDAIVIHRDTNVGRLPLLDRLKQVRDMVVLPRLQWEKDNPELFELEKRRNQFLPIFLKDFFEIWDIAAIMTFGAHRLPHLCDGIIFTPAYAPYVPGTCFGLLKWKPPHMNTVDFRAEFVRLNGAEQNEYSALFGHTVDPDFPFAVKLLVGEFGIAQWKGNIWAAPTGEPYKQLLKKFASDGIDGGIWECTYEMEAKTPKPQLKWDDDRNIPIYQWSQGELEAGGWVVERVRTDRRTPNDKRVVKSVFKSIQDGISFLDLLEYIEGIRKSGKKSLTSKLKVPSYYFHHGSAFGVQDALNADAKPSVDPLHPMSESEAAAMIKSDTDVIGDVEGNLKRPREEDDTTGTEKDAANEAKRARYEDL